MCLQRIDAEATGKAQDQGEYIAYKIMMSLEGGVVSVFQRHWEHPEAMGHWLEDPTDTVIGTACLHYRTGYHAFESLEDARAVRDALFRELGRPELVIFRVMLRKITAVGSQKFIVAGALSSGGEVRRECRVLVGREILFDGLVANEVVNDEPVAEVEAAVA